MKRKRDLIEIRQFIKPGKSMVIELDDDVEYIVNDDAVSGIEAGKRLVELIRVIDRIPMPVSVRRIKWAIAKEGIIDYLNAE